MQRSDGSHQSKMRSMNINTTGINVSFVRVDGEDYIVKNKSLLCSHQDIYIYRKLKTIGVIPLKEMT